MAVTITTVLNYQKASTGDSTPACLTDGHTLTWYSGESQYVTLSGSDVTAWEDRSANSYDLVSDAGGRPTYNAGIITIGSNQSAYNSSVACNQPFSIFAVLNITDWTAYDIIFELDGGGRYISQDGWEENPGGYGISIKTGATLTHYSTSLNTWYLVELQINGNSSSIQLNDAAATTGAGGTGAMSMFGVGISNAAGALFSAREIIIRNQVDNSTDRTSIRNYLNTKYSIY